MTIFVEAKASELSLPKAIRVEHLEEWTGGDMLISTLSVPCKTRALLQKHIDSSALIVQVKLGEDLAASVGDRLNEHIARMRECTRRVAQHWLLFIGVLTCEGSGDALINGRKTHMGMKFDTVDGAIVGWIARGGVYYSLSRIGLLESWCEDMERRLGQYEAQQYKMVLHQTDYPADLPNIADDPLQIPIRVTDGRLTLVSLPGLGIELVERTWAYCGNLKSSLNFLTDVSNASKVEGIGKLKIERIRKYFGLEDGEQLSWSSD